MDSHSGEPLGINLPTTGTVLFVHTNYPAQFRFLVKDYVARGWIVAFASHTCKNTPLAKVRHIPLKRGKTKIPESKLEKNEAASLQAFSELLKAKRDGLYPDLIYCHSGWGLGQFLKDLFPRAKLIAYSEWWFNFNGEDFSFDPGNPQVAHDLSSRLRMMLRNQGFALELLRADAIVAPTQWQRQQLVGPFRKRCQVIFDGIDPSMFAPGRPSRLPSTALAHLADNTPLLTYATRGLEPYRGFPEFAAAALQLLKEKADWHVAIAGKDTPAYYNATRGMRYGEAAMRAFEDAGVASRVHMLGRLPLTTYRDLLLRSDLHCYFTRPYVLSWSVLEAALCGCQLLSSDVAPVREFLANDQGTTLVDHTSRVLADQLIACTNSINQATLTAEGRLQAARERLLDRNVLMHTVSRSVCMERHSKLAQSVLANS